MPLWAEQAHPTIFAKQTVFLITLSKATAVAEWEGENLTLVKQYPNDRPGTDPYMHRSPPPEGRTLEVSESPKHGVSMELIA